MPTIAQLAAARPSVKNARHVALFASDLQPSDAPTAEMVIQAVNRTVRRLGVCGCVAWMAQEFGDHPDTAVTRMRWARRLTVRPWTGIPAEHDAVPGQDAA